jgi:hypothetical protein
VLEEKWHQIFCSSVTEAHLKKESGEILRDLQTLEDACDLQGLGGDDLDAIVKVVNLNSLGGGFDLNDWPYGHEGASSPSVVPSPHRTPSPCMEPPTPYNTITHKFHTCLICL